MRKSDKIIAFLFFIAAVPFVFGQTANTCNIKYNLFKGDYKSKNYDAAYDNWMYCMDSCPTLSVNIYKYGIKIAEHKLANASEGEKDAARDLVMRVYNQRIEHYPKNEADIWDKKCSFIASQGASDDEVFDCLDKTFKMDPTELSPKNIYKYFDMILVKFKDTDAQRVFDTYDEVGEAVEKSRAAYSKKIDVINAKDSINLSSRDKKNRKIYQQILTNFSIVESGLDNKLAVISTCERLIPFNKKNFEEKKTDAVWLKRAVSRMYNKDCTDDPFYDTLVEAYVEADPSPAAFVFYASILIKKGQLSKAMEYFKRAVEQETDSYKKAGHLYKIGQILYRKGRKSEARSYLYQALKYQPTMGKAYILIANMYASSANSCGTDVVTKKLVYVAALNKARKAKSVDPSISKKANRYIKSYSSNTPTTKEIFTSDYKSGSVYKIGCWINESVRVP